jgi:hypothetical protein
VEFVRNTSVELKELVLSLSIFQLCVLVNFKESHPVYHGISREGPIFLERRILQAYVQGKGKVLMPSTTNGDTLGKAMNICREVSKHKPYEKGNTSDA